MDILTLIPSQVSTLFFLTICGILIRFSLVFSGQYWANTYHHLATYMLLPGIAYVITTVIANNIALSLGMIGALSIVRFRHPVRSPFELTIFFALITIGIAASVNLKYAYLLIVLVIFVIFGILVFQKIFYKVGLSIYQPSFNEGSSKNLVTLKSSGLIKEIENSKNLSSFFYNKDTNTSEYNLIFENRRDTHEFLNKYKDVDLVISCRTSFET